MPLGRFFRLLGLALAAIVTVLVVHLTLIEGSAYLHADRGLDAVDDLRKALVVMEMASKERGPSNAVLGADSGAGSGALLQRQEAVRQRTDAALADALAAVGRPGVNSARNSQIEGVISNVRTTLIRARADVDRIERIPKAARSAGEVRAAIAQMISVIDTAAPAINAMADDAQQLIPTASSALAGARIAAELREHAGRLGSLFIPALIRQQTFTVAERDAIERVQGRIDELSFLLDLQCVPLIGSSPEVAAAHARMTSRYFKDAVTLVVRVNAAGRTDGRFETDALGFTDAYVPGLNVILDVRDALISQAAQGAVAQRKAARNLLMLAASGSIVLALTLGAGLWLLDRRILRPLGETTGALKSLSAGTVTWQLPAQRFNDEMAAVMGAVEHLRLHIIERRALEDERAQLVEQLREQSTTDFLTGLKNRRSFIQYAEAELARGSRHGFSVSLVELDIDWFKTINDTFGHAAGDAVLVHVATLMRGMMREGDIAARLGGEEFVVLLSHCNAEQSSVFAERLRASIQTSTAGSPLARGIRVTASLGTADSATAKYDLGEMLRIADERMYLAKQAGRNRVIAAG